MITAVFDTNILISAFISKGAPYQAMISVLDGKVKLCLSSDILKEFQDVIRRKKFGFSKEKIEQMVMMVIDISEMADPKEKVNIIEEDPQDNKVIECAIASDADYIVTGDPHLLKIKRWKGVKIINVNEFLELI